VLDLQSTGRALSIATCARPVTLVGTAAEEGGAGPKGESTCQARHPLLSLAGTQVVPNDVLVPAGGHPGGVRSQCRGKTVALSWRVVRADGRCGPALPGAGGSSIPSSTRC